MRVRERIRRACDRCHNVKEKCRWIKDAAACERCQRLRSDCRTLRPLAMAGRKPRHGRSRNHKDGSCGDHASSTDGSSPNASSIGSLDANTSVDTALVQIMHVATPPCMFPDMNEREIELLNGIPQGRMRVDHFLVGPSFRAIHHKAVLRHLYGATFSIKDAIIASSALIAYEDDRHTSHRDQVIGHKRAASAISTLRSLKSFDFSDLSLIIMLSAFAVTFALHIDGNAQEICRHSLYLIKPFYRPAMDLDADSLAFLICLVHSETEGCLIRCEVPTIRFEPPPGYLVDRFLGFSTPLLSKLYDLCQISYNLNSAPAIDHAEMLRNLDKIVTTVERWQPTVPKDCATQFEPAEITNMLAQASVYRLSILLIAHRLRHPYGTEVARGVAFSDSIMAEIDSILQRTNRSMPCMDIAFAVACFEITGAKERQLALARTELVIEFSRQLRFQLKSLLTGFWQIKDTKRQLSWQYIPSLCHT